MPGKHARLSPSAAERWLECPASVRMEKLVPKLPDSPYAAEGTKAHELAELKASLAFGKITQRVYDARYAKWLKASELDPASVAEMQAHTDAYVELLRERFALYPNSQIMFEQRMDVGVPSSGGTADAVIFSPVHVEIIDFKYGAGVAVEAEDNPQLRLYGCGALDTYGDLLGDTETVRVTVHQPRLNHVLTEELTADELRRWRVEVVMPRALEALGDSPRFGPSATACRWCEASGRCRAQLEATAETDFGIDPDLLSPDEVADALARVELVLGWAKAVRETSLRMAYNDGVEIPGYKVVRSSANRQITDHPRAIEVLVSQGYERDEVANTKAKGIGDLEKLLGKPLFAELLEAPGIVVKPEGNPALVPLDAKGDPINPEAEAARVFNSEDEKENLL